MTYRHNNMKGEELAKRFHEAYERLAPLFKYVTREESAVPWDDLRSDNKLLMIAVCAEIEDYIDDEIIGG